MDCANCKERLADLMLDELPNHEAVLVQLHLDTCTACSRTYNELKGIGRALENVPALRAVQASEDFGQGVRESVLLQIGSIIRKLAPDKRLKVETQRVATLSASAARAMAVDNRTVSRRMFLMVVAGVVLFAVILFYPSRVAPAHQHLGVLSTVAGQLYQGPASGDARRWPASSGGEILSGQTYSTPETGRARFEMHDGTIVTLGPSSRITIPSLQAGELCNFELTQGEIGIQIPDPAPSLKTLQPLFVQIANSSLRVRSSGHVYMRAENRPGGVIGEVLVLAGSAEILNDASSQGDTVQTFQKASFSVQPFAVKIENIKEPRVPLWRVDLATEKELAEIIGHPAQIVARTDEGVQIRAQYSRHSKAQWQTDWLADSHPSSTPACGPMSLSCGVRARHILPLSPPIKIAMKLHAASTGQTARSFAFGIAHDSGSEVTVDTGRETVLRIRERGRTVQVASLPPSAENGKEQFVLEIARDSSGLTARLSSDALHAINLPLPLGCCKKSTNGPFTPWFQALGNHLLFDEVDVSGTLSAAWLRERLGPAKK